MEIISRFLREQRRYTKDELTRLFKLNEENTTTFIRTLKSYNVLKSVQDSPEQKEMSDLIDEDIQVDEVDSDNANLYVFTFVGVIIYGNRVMKIYPKYIHSISNPTIALKQILKVIEKYNNSRKQIISLYNGFGDSKSFNMLAVILFLLHDYYEHGLYINSEKIIEVNGEGDILWQKTVDEIFPIVSKNRPYYTTIYTRKTVDDNDDFFKRLHQTVLTECSKKLRDAQLLDLFEIDPLYLSEDQLDDLGDIDDILYRITQELDLQFNTRKQILLQTIYSFISEQKKVSKAGLGISIFGTTAFNMVWEKVCSQVFNNQLQSCLDELPFSIKLDKFQYRDKNKLIDVIEKPSWIAADESYEKKASDTLIPDLITFTKTHEGTEMIILDAKYYDIQMEKDKPLRGQPGIESVTKQYLYQLAYQGFADRCDIKKICNCFIFPTEKSEIINKGHVELNMFKKLSLDDIQVRLLPAAKVFSCYLTGDLMDILLLELR